jgi:glycosyltransferase involved in cell wall biosynthesis
MPKKISLAILKKFQDIYKIDSLDLAAINLTISQADPIWNSPERYCEIGFSGLQSILQALHAAGKEKQHIKTILDFPSGWGRVLRFIRAYFSEAEVTAGELEPEALAFLAEQFNVKTLLSHQDFSLIETDQKFDLIWCGSLITHISQPKCTQLLEFFYSILNDNGLLIFTVHGRYPRNLLLQKKRDYSLTEAHILDLLCQYETVGYGYIDYVAGTNYGMSIVKPSKIFQILEKEAGYRIIGYNERLWDNHQDVVVCIKEPLASGNCQKNFISAPIEQVQSSRIAVPASNQIVKGKCRSSVCIPTYNGASYIGEAISSVLDQTLSDFELIIVDDCSSDNTEAIVKSFTDKRIKYFKNSTRLGLVGNWNRCIELSNEPYLCIFHQDDVMMPDNLAEKIKILVENPGVGLVYSDVLQIDTAGELIGEGWPAKPPLEQQGICPGLEFLRTQLLGPNTVSCPGVVVRKECYEKLGGFEARLPFTADWEMWLRLAVFYDVAYLAKSLIKYRWHENNETLNFRGIKDLEHSYKAKILILEKYPELIPDVKTLKSKVVKMYKQLALDHVLHYYRQREYEQAKQYLAFALEIESSEEPSFLQTYHVLFSELADQMQQNQVIFSLAQLEHSETLPPHYETISKQIVGRLSGEDIARQIPIKKLVKAMFFKLGAKPGFRWLYRYREIGKKFLG